mmetsp:Transcript_18457/g.50674  ORF Transcript_18457/g.50674 Transcript_18457/m.50674 type:complete len:245 (-) Transcript_18457:87-821(-)
MGCLTSKGNAAYNVIWPVYPDGDINIDKLRAAVEKLTKEALNEPNPPLDWTALKTACLMKKPQLKAIELLLRHGADPLGNGPFWDSPLASAVKFSRVEMLDLFLGHIDSATWGLFIDGVCQPPKYGSGPNEMRIKTEYGVAEHLLVEVKGRRAKVKSSQTGVAPGVEVVYEDSNDPKEERVPPEDVRVVPVFQSEAVKAKIMEAARTRQTPEDISSRLPSMDIGTYFEAPLREVHQASLSPGVM